MILNNYYPDSNNYDMDITLTIDKLGCNPSLHMTKCVVYGWVSIIHTNPVRMSC